MSAECHTQIREIANRDPLLFEVLNLHRCNAKTLGFIPGEAFRQAADEGRLLGAIVGDRLAGYAFYGLSRRNELVILSHLCVGQSFRRKGIALSLIDFLVKKESADFRGIRVKCRRDYRLGPMWKHLGFRYVRDSPGRSQSGSELAVWFYDFNRVDLFSSRTADRLSETLGIIIDYNIVIDLAGDPDSDEALSSHALLADWLDVDICITPEATNEVDRIEDAGRRQVLLDRVNRFPILSTDHRRVSRHSERLRPLFPDVLTVQDESDLLHIGHALESGLSYFVTRDGPLISRVSDAVSELGLQVMFPWEFITHFDELRNHSAYDPVRLSSTELSVSRPTSGDVQDVVRAFKGDRERLRAFNSTLAPLLADPQRNEGFLIRDGDQLVGFMILSAVVPEKLEVSVFRVTDSRIGRILSRHMLQLAIRSAVRAGSTRLQITDPQYVQTHPDLLAECAFQDWDDGASKLVLVGEQSVVDIHQFLDETACAAPECSGLVSQLRRTLGPREMRPDDSQCWRIEELLWPVKIRNTGIPCYLIPIRPAWAMHLFDSRIAGQDLFGAKSELMLQTENAYYSATRQRIDAPARLMWYVSKDDSSYIGAGAIRAVSRLAEVKVGAAKEVFRAFRHLGVFSWKDVLERAGGDPNGAITGLRFTHTEELTRPIPLREIHSIWDEWKGSGFMPITAQELPADLFLHLYFLGMPKARNE
jgi:GNAT superfamily N-acetyltransferase